MREDSREVENTSSLESVVGLLQSNKEAVIYALWISHGGDSGSLEIVKSNTESPIYGYWEEKADVFIKSLIEWGAKNRG